VSDGDVDALAAYLTRKMAKRPIEGILVTSGDDPSSDPVEEQIADELVGRPPAELARDLYDVARRDAITSGSKAYFVWLRRDGAERPTERFPLFFSAESHGQALSRTDDEHELAAVGIKGMVEMHRVGLDHARLAIHAKETKDQRAEEREIRLHNMLLTFQERSFTDTIRLREMAMAEDERKDRDMARKRQDKMIEAAIRQVEVVLPILGSYVMKGKGAQDNSQLVAELKLVMEFAKSLSNEQSLKFTQVLDAVQMIAMGEVAAGKVIPELVPITVARVMSGMTKEQVEEIVLKILDPAEEKEGQVIPSRQQVLFMELMKTQKNTLLGQVERMVGVKLLTGGDGGP
jgi:hypothetical protein